MLLSTLSNDKLEALYDYSLSLLGGRQSQNKKVYIYPIKDNDGTPLDLINVLTHVSKHSNGTTTMILDRVDTFIGRNDRGEYVKVGGTENLSSPGVIFRYASYAREQERMLGYYIECYHRNLHGLVYTEKGSHYIAQTTDEFYF